MDPQAETRLASRGQHPPRLLLGERVRAVRLAEHVDPAGVRRAGAQHRPGHQVDVLVAAAGVLLGHDVRPEERRLVGLLPGDPQRAGLVRDREPVAALDLDRGRALRPHLADAAASRARSWSSGAARVARTDVAMPPPSYGVPDIRAANSADRSPANTRWAWESTNPGITARPARSRRSSASGARDAGPVHRTRPSSTTTAASCSSPSPSACSAPSSVSSKVTSSAIPVTRRGGHAPPRAGRWRPGAACRRRPDGAGPR